MSELRWGAYDALTTYLTTELNALANNGLILGAAIDFTATGVDRKPYIDVELNLASVDFSAQTGLALYLWLLPRTDGTNFEDGSGAITPARAPDKVIPVRAVNGAQRLFVRLLLTTPDQGKLLIQNKVGASLAATGNTLKYYTYGEEII